MNWKCVNENCFPDTACALGHLDRNNCEHWQQQGDEADGKVVNPDVQISDVPWNGYALGTSDLAILSGRGQPVVIGLIGPPDSGKTSLLSYIYMWCLKYGRMGDWDFAGSWTLGGWESVVQYCRWVGELPPSFPPHTSSTGRHPGILHISVRQHETGALRDILFTDAPGEWFTHWARVPADKTAAGARWVVKHANTILLLIDSDALADAEKLPQTRRATRDLIERVGAEKGECSAMVLWTKDDVEVPENVREGLSSTCKQFLPNEKTWRTTVTNPETIERCFVEAIRMSEDTITSFDVIEPRLSTDPFLAFRGIHVGT